MPELPDAEAPPLAPLPPAADLAPGSVPELLERIVTSWLATFKPRTRDGYRRDLERFGRWWSQRSGTGVPGLHQAAGALLLPGGPETTSQDSALARERVRTYIADLNELRLSPATINRRLAALRSLCAEASEWGLGWTLRVKAQKSRAYRDTTGPPQARIEAVLTRLEAQSTERARRDRAVLLLLYDVALRRSAIADLRIEHLELEAEPPSLWYQRKGDAEGELTRKAVSGRAARAIAFYLELRGRSPGPLWRSVAGRGRPSAGLTGGTVWTISRRYGLGPPHGLRHAAATGVARATGSVFMVRELLDHQNVSTSQRYVDAVEDLSGKASRILAGEEDP